MKKLLQDCATTEGAKELAARLMPSADVARARAAQKRTTDAKRLVQSKGAPSFGAIRDVQNAVDRAEKGASLSQGELLAIANVLSIEGKQNIFLVQIGKRCKRIRLFYAFF